MKYFTLILPFLLAADWPRYLGPNRDNHSAETKLNWDWKKAPPKEAWAVDVGHGFAGVAVAGGKVFLFHREANEEILAALDPATGKELWKFAYPTRYRDDFEFDDGPRCVPLVEGETVFTYGADGDLHAVEAATGKKRWGRNLLKDYAPKKGYFGIGSGPILLDGKLLVNVGAKGAGIVAFDPATGKELWKCSDDGPSYSTPTSIQIEGKPHAVFFTRAGLLVVNGAGDVIHSHPWRARIDASVNAATPLILDGSIFLSTSYNTGAILLKPEGKELTEVWKSDKSLSCHYNTPVRVGDHLFGIDGRQEGGGARLRCIDWKTGEVKWSAERFGCASLIAVDGGLLAVTDAGELVGFGADAKAFAERGRVPVLKGVVRAAPALANGQLIVRDEKRLVCVSLK
jgi:outer membrane protein assembly factor BamB